MKHELHAIMEANDLDGIWVVGPAAHNPAMVYLTGGAHVTDADLIIPRGKKGVLFHGMMERDEAAKSGFETRSYSNYRMSEFLKEANGDRLLAIALMQKRMLIDVGLEKGKVALYGQMDAGRSLSVFSQLMQVMPELKIGGDLENKVLMTAMFTKDDDEMNRIRRMGKVTTEVVRRVQTFLSSQYGKNGILVDDHGQPVTVGHVKKRINLWLAELGAENPEGTIFAIGRDAGVPHSSGADTDILALGKTIVFDIFPCEAGGGYYYDFTRTWCLGYAPEAEQKLFNEVQEVFDRLMEALKTGENFSLYQKMTCDLFEELGHPTVKSNPETEEGYIHSIGHGLGLRVHEAPSSGMLATERDRLVPGTVFTIEPGLYYPSRGMGVRIEDTVICHPDGSFEVPAEYPYDLVIPVKS